MYMFEVIPGFDFGSGIQLEVHPEGNRLEIRLHLISARSEIFLQRPQTTEYVLRLGIVVSGGSLYKCQTSSVTAI